MPIIHVNCRNPACGKEVEKYHASSKLLPKYCSRACAHAHSRTFDFTEAMNEAIRLAYRGGYGVLKRLWREDAHFETAGISYALMKRQLLVLRLTKERGTTAHSPWTVAEEAYVLGRWQQGSPVDAIARTMRKHGWQRSPGAIIARMEAYCVGQRHGALLNTRAIADAFGVDIGTVGAWIQRGDLVALPHAAEVRSPHYCTWEAVRAFVIAHPNAIARGKPDIVFLIGLLTTPSSDIGKRVRSEREENAAD